MGFISFFILACIVIFLVVMCGMGVAFGIVALPFLAVIFALWLLFYHTFVGVLFVAGCFLLIGAVKGK
jgi:hypothetical protein